MKDETVMETEDRAFEENYRAQLIQEINERLKFGTIRELRLIRRIAINMIDEPAAKEVSP